jgi:hypothetical protein
LLTAALLAAAALAAALLAAAALAAATLAAATLAAATLAAATLLAAAVFLTVFVAVPLLAALLASRHGFHRFVRIVLFFHNTFLSFADWSFALREKTISLSDRFRTVFWTGNFPASERGVMLSSSYNARMPARRRSTSWDVV